MNRYSNSLKVSKEVCLSASLEYQRKVAENQVKVDKVMETYNQIR